MADKPARDHDAKVAEFEHMWTTERDDWLLLGDGNEEHLLPYRRATGSVLLIDEDDELWLAVVARMRLAGIPVVTSPPDDTTSN